MSGEEEKEGERREEKTRVGEWIGESILVERKGRGGEERGEMERGLDVCMCVSKYLKYL